MPTLAAVDVGSNAVRLFMVRVSPLGALVNAKFRRYALRLGTDVFAHGEVGKVSTQKLVRVFKDIAARMRRRGVESYRAVATSALRDAKNRRAIVRRIRKVSGLRLEVVSGLEEARLSRDALAAALGSVPPATLLVDLGGGSLEIQRAASPLGRSLPFGTVRLMQTYPALQTPLDRHGIETVARFITADLARRLVGRAGAPLAVGTGGNFDALARLVPAKTGCFQGIDVKRLKSFAVVLGRLTPAERAHRFGLRPDRADVILPAALVITALVRIFAIKRFVVPGTGLREAVVHELAERTPAARRAHALAQARGGNPRLAQLAEQLFLLLTPLHHLWPPARLPLLAAAHGRPSVLGGGPLGRRGTRADLHATRMLAAVLELARELERRGVTHVSADLTRKRFTLRAGLDRPLATAVTRGLASALDAPVRVE